MQETAAPITTSENRSEVSKFYLACRNGDVEFVKDHLMKLSDIKSNVNPFEPTVKSTPLHAACYYGHKEIVQLLLEHECDRSQINCYGLTAYEEAANDEIRQLFKRPTDGSGVHRFQDETIDGCFDFVKRPKEIVSIYEII
jgi:ankyrin repeat protein